MLHDPDFARARERDPADQELGLEGIGWRMLGGAALGLVLVELIGHLTHHPGVASILGAL